VLNKVHKNPTQKKNCNLGLLFLDYFSAPVDTAERNSASLIAEGRAPEISYVAAYPPPLQEPLQYRPGPPPEAQYPAQPANAQYQQYYAQSQSLPPNSGGKAISEKNCWKFYINLMLQFIKE
jgi:hypothetical protein